MYTTANAPPPSPELYWCATPAANAVAIAASTALPPLPKISRPASAAGPTEVTTIPRVPQAGPGVAAPARAASAHTTSARRDLTRGTRIGADRNTQLRGPRASVGFVSARLGRSLVALWVALLGCSRAEPAGPVALLRVRGFGEIRVALDPALAPRHVANFVALADAHFYDGTTFHRVIPNFMIQGGDPNSKDASPSNDGFGGPGYRLQPEFNAAPHVPGVLSMARTAELDGAGSQFFLMTRGSESWRPQLDGQFTVFGHVPEGQDVVDRISAVPRDSRDRPLENVVLDSVTIVER